MAGEPRQAETALRNAILIAPSYAEAHANLAGVVAGLGRTIQAARLMRRAVELDPRNREFRERAATYEALAPGDDEPLERADDEPLPTSTVREPAPGMPHDLLERYDVDGIGDDLATQGYCVLPAFLSTRECSALIDLFPRTSLFEREVELKENQGHGGSYRFFRRPLPSLVQRLRARIYSVAAPVANQWMALVGRPERFPATHPEFLKACADAGQERSTPILLRYRAPAVNHLHRDVWGRLVFPFQLAVTLSPRASDGGDGYTGGAFVLEDETPGRRAKRSEIVTDQGDAVLFCARDRLERVGAGYALVPVAHGMAPLTAGERYVLGCPFHEYR